MFYYFLRKALDPWNVESLFFRCVHYFHASDTDILDSGLFLGELLDLTCLPGCIEVRRMDSFSSLPQEL